MIVPVPHHPTGFYTLSDQHNYETLVLADAVKLKDHWIKQSLAMHECDTLTQLATLYNRNATFMSGDDNPIAPLHADTKTCISFMKERLFMHSQEMPRMNFSEARSNLKFVNGRHRTINLINCGAPFIPALLSSNAQNVAAFKEKFEWVPQQHESAFLRTTLRAAPAKPRFG